MMDFRIFLKLTVIMAVISICAVVITTSMLYLDEFREHQEILIDTVDRQRRSVQAVVEYTKEAAEKRGATKDGLKIALSETLSMIINRASNQAGTEGTIEVTTARKQDGLITFVSHRGKRDKPTVIKVGSDLAVPMQLALEGKTGVTRSHDYDGHDVLAAYTYVDSIKLGIVAKARINAISSRFIKGAVFAIMPAMVLVVCGVLYFFWSTHPIIAKLRKENELHRRVSAERAEALVSLKEHEERLRCFFDAAFEGVAITRNGIFIDGNDRIAKMYGYNSIKEMIGMPVANLVHKDDMELVRKRMADEHADSYEHRSIKKDGSIVDVEVHGRRAMYQGEVARITAIHDLTDQKKALAKIEDLHKLQRRKTKIEAIGSFAAGIAHDFNNSLTPIVGNCDLLLMEIDREKKCNVGECRLKVLKIATAAETAALLVRRIQSFTRKDGSTEQPFPLKLDECVREAFNFLRSIIPMSIDMELNIEKNLSRVASTDIMIRQILMNLCKNSAHAMDDDEGLIVIEVSNEIIRVERFGVKPGKFVRIDVIDDGSGMPEEVLERAVDPYFSTKEDKEGTGLGLAVVNGILENHGGIIHLQSTEGIGTTASIYLPAIENDGNVESFCRVDKPLPQGNGQRILFVDDEKPIVEMAQQLLTELSYDVIVFTDSREAFKEFCLNPAAYDILMSDMTMPDMSGIVLIQKIKEINPEIKVILSSGFGANGRMKADLFSDLINAYLQKPVTIKQYAETLFEVFSSA